MRAIGSRNRVVGRLVVGLLLGGAIYALPPVAGSPALAQSGTAGSQEAAPKQVSLSQKTIDNLIAAQKQIRAEEAKAPPPAQGQAPAPDPKTEAKIEGIVKANGFASMGAFADASYSVGTVLAGMDPKSGTYIGTQAALKKQIAEVQADKEMPANEKKEAMAELNAALKEAPNDKPLAGNVDVVKANLSKLNEGLGQSD